MGKKDEALAADERRALDDLFSAAYEELKRLASTIRGDFPKLTLSPTALVDEAWMKLARSPELGRASRADFKRIAAHAMRQVLVEAARRQGAQKRGRTVVWVTLDDTAGAPVSDARQILEIDIALDKLAEVDARQARIVEYRFFGGMTNEEIAEALGIGTSSVERAGRLAYAWLKTVLGRKR
jgi:RNA polymerase sigma factor (TIGR02999 family)